MKKEYFHVSDDNLELGTILQPKYGQVIQNSHYYMFNDHNYAQYLKEMLIEEIRVKDYPTLPSRLKCIYVVDNEESARSYMKTYNKKFLYKVQITEGIIAKVDMKWMDYNRQSLESIRIIANSYFSGIQNEGEPFFEVIVEGKVIIENKIN
ncbi:DUF2441 domain-containing protein [Niallia sp. FSL R7-0271]|uniref:DUF2441 domain-containing protein n=1 Tax=Niallia sp. FSL R7-0271 TaxID=2921678 RepID=UPI0030F8FC61